MERVSWCHTGLIRTVKKKKKGKIEFRRAPQPYCWTTALISNLLLQNPLTFCVFHILAFHKINFRPQRRSRLVSFSYDNQLHDLYYKRVLPRLIPVLEAEQAQTVFLQFSCQYLLCRRQEEPPNPCPELWRIITRMSDMTALVSAPAVTEGGDSAELKCLKFHFLHEKVLLFKL